MTRALDADFVTEILADKCQPAWFFEGTFSAGTINLWSGLGDISWDSKTWLGNGWLHVGSSASREADDLSANGIDIELAGVPQQIISLILSEPKQGTPGKLWLGFVNDAMTVLAPYLAFHGKLDVPEIRDDPERPAIILSYETALVDLQRPREYRYNTEGQIMQGYADDKGFEYLRQVVEWSGFWGTEARPANRAPTESGSDRSGKGGKSRKERRQNRGSGNRR